MHAGIQLRDIIYFDVWYSGHVQCMVKCVCIQLRDFGTRCVLLVCEGSNVVPLYTQQSKEFFLLFFLSLRAIWGGKSSVVLQGKIVDCMHVHAVHYLWVTEKQAERAAYLGCIVACSTCV